MLAQASSTSAAITAALLLFRLPLLARHGFQRLHVLALKLRIQRRQRGPSNGLELARRPVERLLKRPRALGLWLRRAPRESVDAPVQFSEPLAQFLLACDHAAF